MIAADAAGSAAARRQAARRSTPTAASRHAPRSRFVEFLRPGDLVIANDAATLPASLHGVHLPTGAYDRSPPRGRRRSRRRRPLFRRGRVRRRRLPHAHRGPPAAAAACAGRSPGARPARRRPSRRCSAIRAGRRCASTGRHRAIWAGLARHGRPIQYAHLPAPLALWDVWTPIAGAPVAFEPPSAGFALDWARARAMRARGVGFATITHAAGISSTGDEALDARLPFDEPYEIPEATAAAIRRARARGGRIVAVGTTVRARARACRAPHRRSSRPGEASRTSGSARPAGCASSTRSSPARTSRAPATTSCCAPSSTTRRWRA